MHKPIAYQREKGIELRTVAVAVVALAMIVANVATLA